MKKISLSSHHGNDKMAHLAQLLARAISVAVCCDIDGPLVPSGSSNDTVRQKGRGQLLGGGLGKQHLELRYLKSGAFASTRAVGQNVDK